MFPGVLFHYKIINMKNNVSALTIVSGIMLLLSSCGGSSDKDKKVDTLEINTKTTKEITVKKEENAPAGFEYQITPDSAILGKTREALIKVVSAKSVSLQDAEGASTGSEITFKLSITNKSTLDNKKFFSVSSSDARLQMDNGNLVPASSDTGENSPSPESTTESEWVFKLPPNASPVKLNFFLDGTRVSVNVNKK